MCFQTMKSPALVKTILYPARCMLVPNCVTCIKQSCVPADSGPQFLQNHTFEFMYCSFKYIIVQDWCLISVQNQNIVWFGIKNVQFEQFKSREKLLGAAESKMLQCVLQGFPALLSLNFAYTFASPGNIVSYLTAYLCIQMPCWPISSVHTCSLIARRRRRLLHFDQRSRRWRRAAAWRVEVRTRRWREIGRKEEVNLWRLVWCVRSLRSDWC